MILDGLFSSRLVEILNYFIKKIRYRKLRFFDLHFVFFAHRLNLIRMLSKDHDPHNMHFVTGSRKSLRPAALLLFVVRAGLAHVCN